MIMYTSEANMNTLRPEINFGSDNWADAHPTIAENLLKHSSGFAKPCSESDLDIAVEEGLRRAFEHEKLAAFYVATGTAANSLALNAVTTPGGVVFAHRESHVVVDECGAPEYLSGGQLRIAQIPGLHGKMDPEALRLEVARYAAYDVHGGRPVAISLTNPTESGTVYTLDEVEEIAAVAKDFHLALHMDGARFGNAVAALGCTPADLTWKRGVDILSFGATKNGCWCAEVVLFFNTKLTADFPYIRKRSAQLFSKSRSVSAQLEAYLARDIWLDIARHSNKMCASIGDVFSERDRLVQQPQANELFVIMSKPKAVELEARGVVFMEWPTPSRLQLEKEEAVYRFVTSFATTEEDVRTVARLLRGEGS